MRRAVVCVVVLFGSTNGEGSAPLQQPRCIRRCCDFRSAVEGCAGALSSAWRRRTRRDADSGARLQVHAAPHTRQRQARPQRIAALLRVLRVASRRPSEALTRACAHAALHSFCGRRAEQPATRRVTPRRSRELLRKSTTPMRLLLRRCGRAVARCACLQACPNPRLCAGVACVAAALAAWPSTLTRAVLTPLTPPPPLSTFF